MKAKVLAVILVFLPSVVLAQDPFKNPLTNKAQSLGLAAIVGGIVKGVLGITGVVAAVFVIWGGFRLIFARGNEQEVDGGKKTILWAIIGLLVSFLGYILIDFVLKQASGFGITV